MSENARMTIVDQTPVLERALREALRDLPDGSRARNLSDPCADYTLQFDLITEYDPSLCYPGLSPVVWTKGSWNAHLSKGDAADEVAATLAKHMAMLADVEAGLYRP